MQPPVLYLDFDGPLHPWPVYRTPDGIELRAEGALFMHASVLTAVLTPYPDVRIVLSTSWVVTQGLEAACAYLPPALKERVIGGTWEPELDEFDPMSWRRLTRYEQIHRHALRHQQTHWLALDDDNGGWPDSELVKLVHCHNMRGLGDLTTREQLVHGLAWLNEGAH